MRVLFVASEFTPLAKVGGLGDVIGSLPKALIKLGVNAKVIVPFYESIDRKLWRPKQVLKLDTDTSIWKTKLPKSSVEVFLIYNKKYLSTGPIYFEKTAFAGSSKEIQRFTFFSKVVFSLLAQTNADYTQTNVDKNSAKSAFRQRESAISGWRPDIIHCNDWHSGALVKTLREMRNEKLEMRLKTVFTIHNLANQGTLGGTNWMAEGIKNADIVTTVSPTYAKEITTKKYGAGLEKLLKRRAQRGELIGILNGIDYDFWRPIKREKAKFQKALGLKGDKNAPIFGLVSRLTTQKGIRLILPLIDKFVRRGSQFVFLGQGEEEIEKGLVAAARRHPNAVYAKIGFDAELANQIYANSDFFLMPSRFEPSGLGQMIAMRYGTPPIVRATGGLKDSVKHLKTGFVFQKENSTGLARAIKQAVGYFNDKPAYLAMQRSCLKEDFSWQKSARKYLGLYQRVVKKPHKT